ncbi:MAG: hypothetical protein MUC81_01835 [Bacteroidia bacterium]|nr:hypothetical protein [Bacteroidia bacterium]
MQKIIVTIVFFLILNSCSTHVNKVHVKTYHNSGKVWMKGTTIKGVKHGWWYTYTETGKIVSREKFKHDSLIVSYLYNNEGKLWQIKYPNGKTVIKSSCGCN